MAAAHVTPRLLGTLMGISLLPPEECPETRFRQILRDRHGIKSNYVGGEWTGVSLARWKDLANHLRSDRYPLPEKSHSASSLQIVLSTAVWSMAVWECSQSKQCLLEYYLAVQDASGVDMFNEENEFVKRGVRFDPVVQADWVSRTIDDERLQDSTTSSSLIQTSLNSLTSDNAAIRASSMDTARAVEVLCAIIMTTKRPRNLKPTTPNGYYGYDGGEIKPDCVEVAVRELIDLLLWDEASASFDSSRLPATAVPELVALYQSAHAIPSESNDSSEGPSWRDSGREWFDMLSDIPGCDYLSTSSNGRPYELTPTLRNVAKVCRRLLYNDGSLSTPVTELQDWTSLLSLQEVWHGPEMQISFDRVTQKAKMSDDINVHEVATIGIVGQSTFIEMRLRCDWARNTGFATVTHLRQFKESDIIDKTSIDTLLSRRKGPHQTEYTPLSLVALALLGDEGLIANQEDSFVDSFACAVLAARYGIDRRGMMQLAATSDLEREEIAYKTASRQSEQILKAATIKICDFLLTCKGEGDLAEGHRALGIQLLGWVMAEKPQVDGSLSSRHPIPEFLRDPTVEQKILGLPRAILTDIACKRVLEEYWPRGRVLLTLVDWKTGKLSPLELLREVKLKEWPTFMLLKRRLEVLNNEFQ